MKCTTSNKGPPDDLLCNARFGLERVLTEGGREEYHRLFQ
jgi:hypothetical protein